MYSGTFVHAPSFILSSIAKCNEQNSRTLRLGTEVQDTYPNNELKIQVLDKSFFCRSFRPDLILLRQSVRGLGSKEDWRSLLFGMKYGNIPSINSLASVFNFLEKPWVVSIWANVHVPKGKII